jgi:hypothetical protein
VSHGRAVSEGGALRVPGGAVVLTAAVGDAPPLDDTTPLPEEGALARAEGDSDALVEGGGEMEGDSVPLLLPLGDPEASGLRDAEAEARGEADPVADAVCSAPVLEPLGDVEGVPRNVAVGCGEVEGLPLPETARAVSVGRPTLLLGE